MKDDNAKMIVERSCEILNIVSIFLQMTFLASDLKRILNGYHSTSGEDYLSEGKCRSWTQQQMFHNYRLS